MEGGGGGRIEGVANRDEEVAKGREGSRGGGGGEGATSPTTISY